MNEDIGLFPFCYHYFITLHIFSGQQFLANACAMVHLDSMWRLITSAQRLTMWGPLSANSNSGHMGPTYIALEGPPNSLVMPTLCAPRAYVWPLVTCYCPCGSNLVPTYCSCGAKLVPTHCPHKTNIASTYFPHIPHLFSM